MENKRKHSLVDNDVNNEYQINKKLRTYDIQKNSRDDSILSGNLGDDEDDGSSLKSCILVESPAEDNPQDCPEKVSNDEFTYPTIGYMEKVIAWSCNPEISQSYFWNNEERTIPDNGIGTMMEDDIFDDTISITSSSAVSVKSLASEEMKYLFTIDFDYGDSDDDSDDKSGSTGSRETKSDDGQVTSCLINDSTIENGPIL